MRHSVINSSHLIEYQTGQGGFRTRPVMMTLTYRNADASRPDHIQAFHTRIRNWLDRRGIAYPYVWVGELQQRGALHYHVIAWLPYKLRLPKPDMQGWWPHGHTRIEAANSAVAYIVKYATKLKSKMLGEGACYPSGFRMHGTGGLKKEHRNTLAFTKLPGWLREQITPEHRMRRTRGGFVSRVTEEFFHSIFKIERIEPWPGGARLTLGPRHQGVSYPCIAF